MGNFDGSTKRCLGDPGAEIRRTIRPRRVVVVEVLGSEEKEGERGVFFHHVRRVRLFFPHSLLPFFLPPPPSFMREGRRKKKRGAVKLERVPDI